MITTKEIICGTLAELVDYFVEQSASARDRMRDSQNALYQKAGFQAQLETIDAGNKLGAVMFLISPSSDDELMLKLQIVQIRRPRSEIDTAVLVAADKQDDKP